MVLLLLLLISTTFQCILLLPISLFDLVILFFHIYFNIVHISKDSESLEGSKVFVLDSLLSFILLSFLLLNFLFLFIVIENEFLWFSWIDINEIIFRVFTKIL